MQEICKRLAASVVFRLGYASELYNLGRDYGLSPACIGFIGDAIEETALDFDLTEDEAEAYDFSLEDIFLNVEL